ncbi:cobalt-zinc-cadmium efflux system membrane fusion protein [Kordia periserrulae]|uniref:Cobalt-zinc-cadmium efflux system membrane fusion protein n=1 Tax=Kordia periserrulae TaxID=701523 RepID=A0A2T6BUV1_9FLAO|nr:efflux RND transporter periplasmic adaptor subunit [Kordia periserrulae]PTX59757.1 cobalt-zinc-cadmium efflux system membrane fusion protein [Kordia periserrulae]
MQRILYKITLLGLLFSFYSCGTKENENAVVPSTENSEETIQITQIQFEQNNMQLGSLQEQSFPSKIHVSGMIDVPPENKAVVNATMGGYIKKLPYLEGDVIKKGQLLVTIENPEFVSLQQAYSEIHERLTFLKAEYERQQTMLRENITSQKSFLKAESDYKTAVATYNGLRAQLKILNISPSAVEKGIITSSAPIYAPISGSITKVNVTKGAYISPANPIVEIIDNSHIHLELSVFEKDILKVKKEQLIEFSISETTSETFQANVHLVGTSIEPNRTIKVHGHIEDEAEYHFLTGMFVEADIITDTFTALALPNEAIVTIDDMAYVLLLLKKEGNTYHFAQQKIDVGARYSTHTIIKNAARFDAGTQFLTKGAFNLMGE